MRRITLRSVLGESNVTDSYFTTNEVQFNTIDYNDIAFCNGNKSMSYKQYLSGESTAFSGLYGSPWMLEDTVLCARLDFIDFKRGFILEDLIGKSFTSFCASCNDAYILTFVEGNEISNTCAIETVQTISSRPSSLVDISELPINPIFTETNLFCYSTQIGVELFDSCADGKELVKKIITILQEYENQGITSHYAFFFCKDTTLYIADYRKVGTSSYWPVFYDFNIMKPKLAARYIGPSIEVKDNYNTDDVEVKLVYPDKSEDEVDRNYLRFIDTKVRVPGKNVYYVYYENQKAEYEVTGKYTFVDLNAVYTGEPLYVGDTVKKEDVTVTEVYMNENFTIPITRWEFVSKNEVTYRHMYDGCANFWIRAFTTYYGERFCKVQVQVAIIDPEPVAFEAHYHGIQRNYETASKDGTPIIVGHSFEKSAIHAHVLTSQKEWIDIKPSDIMISDTVVRKPGRNIYTATYRWKDKVFTDLFEVFGYVDKQSLDRKFKLYKIEGKEQTDVTDDYEQEFRLLDTYLFSVKAFHSILEINCKYRAIIPKDTGLNQRHATEWYINNKKDDCKMTLVKIFNEEGE